MFLGNSARRMISSTILKQTTWRNLLPSIVCYCPTTINAPITNTINIRTTMRPNNITTTRYTSTHTPTDIPSTATTTPDNVSEDAQVTKEKVPSNPEADGPSIPEGPSMSEVELPSVPPSLAHHLKQRIQISGPITMASYMKVRIFCSLLSIEVKREADSFMKEEDALSNISGLAPYPSVV